MFRRPLHRFLQGSTLALALACAAHAQAVDPRIGVPAPGMDSSLLRVIVPDERPLAGGAAEAWVTGEEPVLVDREALRQARPGLDRLEMTLLSGVRLVGQLDRLHGLSTSVGFSGRLEGEETGTFTLVMGEGAVHGNIRSSRGEYWLRMRSGRSVIQTVDPGLLPSCGTGPEHGRGDSSQGAPGAGGDYSPGGGDDGTVFDVMVVWTSEAETDAGGHESMNALVDLSILESNLSYENSAIPSRLRLVYKSKIGYDESITDFVGKLADLQSTADGHLDDVHPIRDAVGADMVALLVDDAQYCGVAYRMDSLNGFAPWAFSVTNWSCSAGSLTFPHELGHNQGCAHDHDNANDGLYSYSFGHRFFGQSGAQYRTVMAYAPGTRIRHFSNPDVNFDGTPTGVPSGQPDPADNARTINNAATTIAGWRTSVLPVCRLLCSFRADVDIGGVTYDDGDVVELDLTTGALSMLIDISDVIPHDVNVDALHALDDGSYLISFHKNTTVPGLNGGPDGDAVKKQDIVRFLPTSSGLLPRSHGDVTAGTFEFYFDGSDVNLSETEENVDALSMNASGHLHLSTTKAWDVGGLSGNDEDLFVFVPTSLGASTSGSFQLLFDGSAGDAKLSQSSEDVDAHYYDLSSDTLTISTRGDFRVPKSLVGEDDDLLAFVPTALGAATAGTWMIFFNGDHYALAPADIDAIHLLHH